MSAPRVRLQSGRQIRVVRQGDQHDFTFCEGWYAVVELAESFEDDSDDTTAVMHSLPTCPHYDALTGQEFLQATTTGAGN